MIAILFVFLIGLAVGSFLNVVVLRTQAGRQLTGRSQCPNCGQQLRAFDMIPVFSYLLLRGKCRNCSAPISAQYPLIEFATAVLFTLFFLRYYYGFSLPENLGAYQSLGYFLRDAIFTVFLVVLFVYDLRYFLILDRFTVPAMFLAFFINLAVGVPMMSLLIGAAVIGGFFLLQFVISKGAWIGGGDVRMGVLMGLILGLKMGLFALVLSYAVGAFAGIIMILTDRAGWRTKVPFGSFLALATLVMLLGGEAIMQYYVELVGGPQDIIQFLQQAPIQNMIRY